MALNGGSVAVDDTVPTQLSGAVPGVVRCKTLTFRSMTGNTGLIAIGKSDVDISGVPSIVVLAGGESFTINGAQQNQGAGQQGTITVDFSTLYAIAAVDDEVLHIAYAD